MKYEFEVEIKFEVKRHENPALIKQLVEEKLAMFDRDLRIHMMLSDVKVEYRPRIAEVEKFFYKED